MSAVFSEYDQPDRAAMLARATLERARAGAGESQAAWRRRAERVETRRRAAVAREAAPLLALTAAGGPSSRGDAPPEEEDALQRARARLELDLKTREGQLEDLRRSFESEKADHSEAKSTLQLQRNKLRELQEERESLLKHVKDAESRLRLAENQREQSELELEKIRTKRQAVGDQALKNQEQINELQAEIERLKAELVEARRTGEREKTVAREEVKVAVADSHRPVLGELWTTLNQAFPDVFIETHVPNRETFERICEVLIEMMAILGVLEVRGKESLGRLRDVANPKDRIGSLFERFSKTPGLKPTLRDYVAGGARIGNLKNLLSALRSLQLALVSGQYKAIVRLPELLTGELDPSKWPVKAGRLGGDDASIGRYYKETARKTIPDNAGTGMRRQANADVSDDFMDEMKRGG